MRERKEGEPAERKRVGKAMEASGAEVEACGAGQRKSEKRSAGKDGFGSGYFRGSAPYLSGSRDLLLNVNKAHG